MADAAAYFLSKEDYELDDTVQDVLKYFLDVEQVLHDTDAHVYNKDQQLDT